MPIIIILLILACLISLVLVFAKRRLIILIALGLLAIGYLVFSDAHGTKTVEDAKLNEHVDIKVVFVAHSPFFGGNDGYLVLKLTDSLTGNSASKYLISGYNLRNTAKVRIVAIGEGRAKIFEDTMHKAWEVSDRLVIEPATWQKQ